MKVKITALGLLLLFSFSCNQLGNFAKVKITNPGRLLSSYSWELENISSETGNETLRFNLSNKAKELSFSKTYGAGRFQSIAVGTWNYDKEESILNFIEYDATENIYKEPKAYTLIEISKKKLVLSFLNDRFEYVAHKK